MCGIFGIITKENLINIKKILKKSSLLLRHRGPDDEGFLLWNGKEIQEARGDESSKKNIPHIDDVEIKGEFLVALLSRRLSIIDLSPLGYQPMTQEDKSIWITYNGEIYNYKEIRKELEKKNHIFASKTDTEIILHAYEEFQENCLYKFNGMYAFAILDTKNFKIFCARDEFGIKPFYYYFDGKTFAFSSEIKPLLQIAKKEPNEEIICDYFFDLLDHSEQTFFKGIYQLEPAHYLTLDIKNMKIKIEKYYDIIPNEDIGDEKNGGINPKKLKENSEKLLEIIKDSVRLRLVSDVPVGSCLSGGLDSSTIVSLINKIMIEEGKIESIGEIQKTFTADFEDPRISERKYVEKVIEKVKVESYFTYPKFDIDEIKKAVYYQEEPFLSLSIFAQWCVMKLASKKVKVLLDGQGGDELLAGYPALWSSFSTQLLLNLKIKKLLEETLSITKIGNLTKKEIIIYPLKEMFYILPKEIRKTIRKTIQKNEILKITKIREKEREILNLGRRLKDTMRTSLRQLLRYEDKNSSAFSIEARVPFLDKRLVDFVFSLPASYKINKGWTKFILRIATEGILPDEIRWRKDKIGFAVPEKNWIKENEKEIKKILKNSSGILNEKYIIENFDTILQKGEMWKIINLKLWMDTFFI